MNDEQKTACFEFLKRYGITRVTAMFDGSGDSGQIEEIKVEGLANQDDLKTIEVATPPLDPQNYHPPRAKTLDNVIDDIVNEFLEATGYDWYNNDGGYGTVTIVPAGHYCHVDMHIRETTSHQYALDESLTRPSNLDPEVEAKCQPKYYDDWWGSY